jgi:hypothetical protein
VGSGRGDGENERKGNEKKHWKALEEVLREGQ